MKYSVIIPRCGGGAVYEGNPVVGCEREDVEILNGYGDNPGSARNEALARASGDWIVFCDADDRLRPEIWSVLDRMTDANPDADILRFRYAGNCAMYPLLLIVNHAYRRCVMGDVRFPALSMGEDMLYLEHCLRRSEHLVETDEICYDYTVNQNSLTKRAPTRRSVLDTVSYAVEYLRIIGTGEPCTSITRFGLTTLLTEHVSSWITGLPNADKDVCWNRWFAAMREPDVHFTRWGAFGKFVLKILPYRFIAIVLFVVPHWLKTHLRKH